jgi:5-methylcytosine-specific restriction endonuclease McrA
VSRREFPKSVRQAALLRSDQRCEAVGERYGFEPGQRCDAPLAYGVQFDHELPDWYGGEPTLENCRAICVRCHKHATHRVDAPAMAKARRNHEKHTGTKAKSRRPMPGSRASGFRKRMDGRVERRND